jgi:hypothetical protein
MTARQFPQRYVAALQELGARLIDSRKSGTPYEVLARELLGGFHDLCVRSGLDRVLDELATAFPPLDPADRGDLAEHPTLNPALSAKLASLGLDGGGPRNARPGLLAEALVGTLELTPVADTERPVALGDDVRTAVVAAMAAVVDAELAAPTLRETMIAETRARCDARYRDVFDKIAPKLDERGMRIVSQPKVALDAVQAVQRALFETRTAVLGRVTSKAIDRAKEVIARSDADAAARIDRPVSLRLTPREVAIGRASEARVPTNPAAIVEALLDSLTELARFAWRTAEKTARTYAASQTYAVGDVVEHPKFGRGSVVSDLNRRIEVEFADGKRTLVHAGK